MIRIVIAMSNEYDCVKCGALTSLCDGGRCTHCGQYAGEGTVSKALKRWNERSDRGDHAILMKVYGRDAVAIFQFTHGWTWRFYYIEKVE